MSGYSIISGRRALGNVRFGSLADFLAGWSDVGFSSEADMLTHDEHTL